MKQHSLVKKFIIFVWGSLLVITASEAQEFIPGKPVICFGESTPSGFSSTLAPEASPPAKLCSFEISYSGFPAEAIIAFEHALNIWESSISSNVPIRVQANWGNLGMNQLASTRPTKLYRGFTGAIQADVWYPVALAEKISGTELNGTAEPDIEIHLSMQQSWYFGIDGNTPQNSYDLVSVVLHEIAHGLGFISSANVVEGNGKIREDGYLTIFDLLLKNEHHQRLSSFLEQSESLYAQITSGQVYIHSPSAAEANAERFPKCYAPNTFVAGASISHLDPEIHSSAEDGSLMAPYFTVGQSNHQPGITVLGILSDLGWNYSKDKPYRVSVYPNPGTGIFTIQLPINLSALALTITDGTGQNVANIVNLSLDWPVKEIDLSHLPNGVYIAIITTPLGDIKRRLMLFR